MRLAAELAFGAHFTRHARHFGREHAQLLDHAVDDGGGTQELAFERPALHLETHRLREVALGDRGDGACDLGRRPQQVVDERVDGGFHLAPRAAAAVRRDALARAALAADRDADARELGREIAVGGDDVVECIGDLAGKTGPVGRQLRREIAVAHRAQRAQEFARVDRGFSIERMHARSHFFF